jgi:hypothetical protein
VSKVPRDRHFCGFVTCTDNISYKETVAWYSPRLTANVQPHLAGRFFVHSTSFSGPPNLTTLLYRVVKDLILDVLKHVTFGVK